MKKIVWKPYWDFEKEEAWLNSMAAQGYSLTDYSWCRYVFEKTPDYTYTYRIELLDQLATAPESREYIEFLESTGIECVAHYMRWVYLRKANTGGVKTEPFNLFTDYDSRITHYKKVFKFFFVLFCMELCIGISNAMIGLATLSEHTGLGVNFYVSLPLLLLSLLFGSLSYSIRKKIRFLKKEQAIHE